MRLLDRLLGKEERGRTLSHSELDKWINQESERLESILVEKSKSAVVDVFEARGKVRESILSLENQPIGESPGRLKSIIQTSKPEFIKAMLGTLEEIEAEEGNYDSIASLRRKLPEILERMAKITVSHGRYIPYAQGEAFNEIQREFKKLIDAQKRLNNAFMQEGGMESLEAVKEAKIEFEKTVEGEKAQDKEIRNLNKSIKELEEKLAMSQSELIKSRQDKDLHELIKKMAKEAQKLESIKTRVYETLTPIGRALRKYQHVAISEKRLSKDEEVTLEGLIENPVNQFLSGRDISTIMQDLKKAMVEGKVEVKNMEKTDRMLQDIEEKLTKQLIIDHQRMLEDKRNDEELLAKSEAVLKNKRLEDLIEQAKNTLEKRINEQKSLEKKRIELKEHAIEARKQLEERLKVFNITLT